MKSNSKVMHMNLKILQLNLLIFNVQLLNISYCVYSLTKMFSQKLMKVICYSIRGLCDVNRRLCEILQ